MLARGREVALRIARRGQRGRHRLHLPGAVADPRPLGRRQHRHRNPPRRFGMIDRRAQRRVAEEALARAGARGHPPARAGQATCRCRAGRWSRSPRRWRASPRILILDEATSALTARRRRQGLRGAQAPARRGAGAALHFAPHARDRRARRRMHGLSQRLAMSRPIAPGARTDNEVVEMMIGREYQHVFPAKPRAAAGEAPPVLEVRDLSWTRPPARHLAHRPGRRNRRPRRPRRPGPARTAARAVRRACAASRGEIQIDGKPRRDSQPARREAPQDRHGADSRRTARPKA